MSSKLAPALAQYISGPDRGLTGRPRWAYAIYSAEGIVLDVMEHEPGTSWPQWVLDLPRLPIVRVTAAEYARWLEQRASSPA